MKHEEVENQLLEIGQNVNALNEALKLVYDKLTISGSNDDDNELIALIRVTQQAADTTNTLLDKLITDF